MARREVRLLESMAPANAVPSPSRHIHAADGTRIAFRVQGQGPAVVLANGLSTSDFFWHYLRPGWTRRHQVVSWDYKGHGDSEPARTDPGTTIPALVDDMRRVMDAAQVERTVLIGFSMGCQVIAEAWRQMPERISGLAFVLGPTGRLFDTALRPVMGPGLERLMRHLPSGLIAPVFGVAHRVAKLPGSLTVGRWMRLYGRSTGMDLRRYVDHFGRLDPHSVVRMALHAGEHDARDVLPTITVPSLVVTGDRDPFAPPRTVGLPTHAAIEGARLLRLAEGTHGSLFEHPWRIGDAIDALLADVVEQIDAA